MDEKGGRKAVSTVADREHFTKALSLHSSRPKGYESAICGQKMAYSNKKQCWSASFSAASSFPLQTLSKAALLCKAKVPGRPSKCPPPGVSREVVPRQLPSLAGGTAPKPVYVLAAIKGSPTLGLSFRMPHHGPHL